MHSAAPEAYCHFKMDPSQLHPQYTHKKFLYQYMATASALLTQITSGMHFGWPSPSLPLLLRSDSPISITSSDGSWIAVMPSIGAPIGAFICTFLVDRIGRKYSIMMVSPLYFINWLAIAYCSNLEILIIARLIVGIMDGISYIAVPIYICEISDHRIRGLLGSSLSTALLLGYLIINILGTYCTIKTTALIAATVPIMQILTSIRMPESPYYYMIKRNKHKAIFSLRKLGKTLNVDEEISKLSTVNKFNFTKYLNLFTKKGSRTALIITVVLLLLQQLTGQCAITFYCLLIFNEAGGGFISGQTATVIYFSVQLFGSIVSSFFVDKVGRRPLLIISIIGSGLGLAVNGIYFYLKHETNVDISKLTFLPLIALLSYNVLFSIGLNSIPILILGEIFSTEIKAFALCLLTTSFAASVIIVSKFFQITNDKYGMHVPFFSFSVCCALGLVFIVFYVPETKGKSLEQIQHELDGEKTNVRFANEIEQKGATESLASDSLLFKT